MPRRKQPPVPTFAPWGDGNLVIRHHNDNDRIGHIRYVAAGNEVEGWHLSWEHGASPTSLHEDPQTAVAAACDAYSAFLEKEAEGLAQHEYEERFTRRRASAVARAVRIPMGGQPG